MRNWAQQGNVYALAIPGGSLALHSAGDGYRAVRLEGGRVVEQLAPPLPLHFAQGVAEDWARTHEVHALATPNAPWRSQPASDKQITLLTKLGIAVPPGLTRGQASPQPAPTADDRGETVVPLSGFTLRNR